MSPNVSVREAEKKMVEKNCVQTFTFYGSKTSQGSLTKTAEQFVVVLSEFNSQRKLDDKEGSLRRIYMGSKKGKTPI